MCRSYASLLHFQEGWSSLQRHSRAPGNLYPGLTPQTGRLGNLQARIPQKMCSKNIQSTSDCGSWDSQRNANGYPPLVLLYRVIQGLEGLRRGVEHTVEESGRSLRGEFLRQFEGLVDYNLDRCRASAEFVNGQPQDVAVHGRKAIQLPVFREPGDELVIG